MDVFKRYKPIGTSEKPNLGRWEAVGCVVTVLEDLGKPSSKLLEESAATMKNDLDS